MADGKKMILTEEDILQEDALVSEIKNSQPGDAMTRDQFTAWLDQLPNS